MGADGKKRLRCRQANDVVGLVLQHRQGLGGGDRNGEDEPRRLFAAQSVQRGANAGAGGNAVIDDDRGAALDCALARSFR